MNTLATQIIEENRQTHAPFLDIGNCNLSAIPNELISSDFYWLEGLNLGKTYFDEKNWKIIESQNNDKQNSIKESEILKLNCITSLRYLGVSFNNINNIEFLESFPQLQFIDLSHNKLTYIKPLKNEMPYQMLNLSYNIIWDLTFLETIPNLKYLNLENSTIKDISYISKLSQLNYLNLSHNEIVHIQALEKLSFLNYLNLAFNEIVNVQYLYRLNKLTYLDLSYNKIKEIIYLKNLSQLQYLYINFNKIPSFTEDYLHSWPLLRSIYLFTNPIKNIPKEIYQANTNVLENIEDYFASLHKGASPNDEVKLIVVGNTTVGKTSLIRFLKEGKFDEKQNSTHGIALERWLVHNTTPSLLVNIWDFGGQEFYHATHRLFLDENAVYIIVWDADTNFQSIQKTSIVINGIEHQLLLEHLPFSYWIESVRYYAPKSTILLVQSKTDKDEPQAIPSFFFKAPYSVYMPSYQVSVRSANYFKSKDKEHLSLFKSFEIKLIEALKIEAAKYKLGSKWIEIRDNIRKLPPDDLYMDYREFESYCRSFDPTIEMKGLIKYLGGAASTILYYENDQYLNKIVFLNPQWVTDTIYTILSYDIQDQNKGEFTRNHVEQVLTKKGIGSMSEIFLELMKKDRFELIFQKPNHLNTFIAPQYLPESYFDSDAIELLRPISPIGFSIHFPRFLPKNIFLRFIVRYGNHAKYIYWKNGIVFDRKNIRVIAECVFASRKIIVDVEDGKLAKELAKELFDVLWELSDQKPEIEVSINRVDYVNIRGLQRHLQNSRNPEIESSQGNWIPIDNFKFLFEETNKIMITGTEIFFSYAWGDAHEIAESREKVVNDLYNSLKNDGYNVVRDKMDLEYKGLISDFMEQIGRGSIVIVAISDKYLKSPYCMFELLEIYRNSRFEKANFRKVIFPIRIENISLNKPSVQSLYFDYWNELEKEWRELITKHSDRVKQTQFAEYEKIRNIYNQLGDLLAHLNDMNASTIELISADNFAQIKSIINKYL